MTTPLQAIAKVRSTLERLRRPAAIANLTHYYADLEIRIDEALTHLATIEQALKEKESGVFVIE